MLGVGNSCVWDGDELNLIVSERSKPREDLPAVDLGMDGARFVVEAFRSRGRCFFSSPSLPLSVDGEKQRFFVLPIFCLIGQVSAR
jgi:hypothetical protein